MQAEGNRDSSPVRKNLRVRASEINAPLDVVTEQLTDWYDKFCKNRHLTPPVTKLLSQTQIGLQQCLARIKMLKFSPCKDLDIEGSTILAVQALGLSDHASICRESYLSSSHANFEYRGRKISISHLKFQTEGKTILPDYRQSLLDQVREFVEAIGVWRITIQYGVGIAQALENSDSITFPTQVPRQMNSLFIKAIPTIEKEADCTITLLQEHSDLFVYVVTGNDK